MKLAKVFSALFGLTAICACALAIHLTFTSLDAEPVLLTPPEEARGQVTALMDAVCGGDYARASRYIYGNPNLGADRPASDEVGELIWNAFASSLSYELVGECRATDEGLAQTVRLTSLDIDSVTSTLRSRSQTLLEERVALAADTSQIYDENNEYREEFVMDVLYDAAKDALEQDARQKTVEFTLNLTYQEGQWWVIGNNEMLDALSAGVLY